MRALAVAVWCLCVTLSAACSWHFGDSVALPHSRRVEAKVLWQRGEILTATLEAVKMGGVGEGERTACCLWTSENQSDASHYGPENSENRPAGVGHVEMKLSRFSRWCIGSWWTEKRIKMLQMFHVFVHLLFF